MKIRKYGWRLLPLMTAALGALAWAGPAQALKLTPEEAVARALQHNLTLKAERLSPTLTDAAEKSAKAAYDTTLYAQGDVSGSPGSISRARVGLAPASSTNLGLDIGVRKSFITGTSFDARLGTSALFGNGSSGGLNPGYQSQISLNVRQSLLQGLSMEANEASQTNARLSREAAEQELERTNESVAADTLGAYWDLHAALSQLDVQKVALAQSQRTLAETLSLIEAGKQANAEKVAIEYQVQVQKRSVQQAEQAVGNARDRLARLIGLVGARSLETPKIETVAKPKTDLPQTSVKQLQDLAFNKRGDYRALLTDLKSKRVSASAASHGLLPKLDFVGSVSLTGLSGVAASGDQAATGLDSSYWASYATDRVGWSVGLVLEIPLENNAAEAKSKTADVALQRAERLVERAELMISEQLNVAWRGVRAAHQQLATTEKAIEVASTKLSNERERYRAGKTTAHILTTIETELIRERLVKEQAVADFNKALVALWNASGTLTGRMSKKI